jgi:FHS family Na+ dependent glucose MFS transporter 1
MLRRNASRSNENSGLSNLDASKNFMEATLQMTGRGREQPANFSLTAAYFAAFVALGLTVGSLGPTLPSLAEQTHVGLGAISYLFTARSMGYVLGAVRGGRLFDRRPGNPVMAVMLLAMSIMMALAPLAPQLWLLLIVMLVLGAAEASLDVGANTLLAWVHGNRVAPFMNAMHSFFGVGALLAPIVVAQTALLNYSMTNSYFVIALLLLPVAAYTFRLPSPAAATARKLEGPTTTNSRLVFLIALFLFLYIGAEVSFAGWIFTYSIKLKLSSSTTAAYLTSLFWGSLTIGRVLTIPAAARFKAGSILMSSLGGCLLSIGVMLISPRSFAAVLIGTIGLGLSMASIFPTTLSFAGQRMRMTGQLTGWIVLGSSAGAMILPLIIGQFFQSVGPSVLMIVIAIILLGAVGVLVSVLRNATAKINTKVAA